MNDLTIDQTIEMLKTNPDRIASVNFPVEAGLLVRKRFRDSLNLWMAYYDHTDYTITEARGLIQSSFVVVIRDMQARKIVTILNQIKTLGES